MNEQARTPMNGDRLFQGVLKSPDYQAHLNKGRTCAFGAASIAIAERLIRRDTYADTKMADQLRVASQIQSFSCAFGKLSDEKRLHRFNLNEHDSNIRKTIIFNHALQAMIERDPSATQSEVLTFLMSTYIALNGDASLDDKTVMKQEFKSTLSGMAHEIFSEQLARQLCYDVQKSTIHDDSLGIDRYFKINDHRYGVDIKSTEKDAEEERHNNENNFVVWSCVPVGSYGDRLRLTPAEVVGYAPRFQQEVDSEFLRLGIDV